MPKKAGHEPIHNNVRTFSKNALKINESFLRDFSAMDKIKFQNQFFKRTDIHENT